MGWPGLPVTWATDGSRHGYQQDEMAVYRAGVENSELLPILDIFSKMQIELSVFLRNNPSHQHHTMLFSSIIPSCPHNLIYHPKHLPILTQKTTQSNLLLLLWLLIKPIRQRIIRRRNPKIRSSLHPISLKDQLSIRTQFPRHALIRSCNLIIM
jgi:hypothetical protein